ncbi:hypothetical protein PN476_13430, partial [Dolichospermum circinale CS-537/05]|nr:hypothetical protein [Dolichospermum circinale CS-537/05]
GAKPTNNFIRYFLQYWRSLLNLDFVKNLKFSLNYTGDSYPKCISYFLMFKISKTLKSQGNTSQCAVNWQ